MTKKAAVVVGLTTDILIVFATADNIVINHCKRPHGFSGTVISNTHSDIAVSVKACTGKCIRYRACRE